MAGNRADWRILRGTIVGSALCVIAAAAMLSASYYFKENMQRQYQASHQLFRNASNQYLAVDEEERIIEEFYPEFVRLYRRGLLGDEQRLSWLETLRGAGEAIKLPELSWKLDAQRRIETAYPLALGTYGVYASAMTLTAGLLHEGDLLRLLDALERGANGQYSVRECALTRQAGDGDIAVDETNIRAECTLDWLTLDLTGDRELKLQ